MDGSPHKEKIGKGSTTGNLKGRLHKGGSWKEGSKEEIIGEEPPHHLLRMFVHLLLQCAPHLLLCLLLVLLSLLLRFSRFALLAPPFAPLLLFDILPLAPPFGKLGRAPQMGAKSAKKTKKQNTM